MTVSISYLLVSRRGGLVINMLDSGSRGQSSSPGWVLGQDTLLSQCLSPPRSINGYQQTDL